MAGTLFIGKQVCLTVIIAGFHVYCRVYVDCYGGSSLITEAEALFQTPCVERLPIHLTLLLALCRLLAHI